MFSLYTYFPIIRDFYRSEIEFMLYFYVIPYFSKICIKISQKPIIVAWFWLYICLQHDIIYWFFWGFFIAKTRFERSSWFKIICRESFCMRELFLKSPYSRFTPLTTTPNYWQNFPILVIYNDFASRTSRITKRKSPEPRVRLSSNGHVPHIFFGT